MSSQIYDWLSNIVAWFFQASELYSPGQKQFVSIPRPALEYFHKIILFEKQSQNLKTRFVVNFIVNFITTLFLWTFFQPKQSVATFVVWFAAGIFSIWPLFLLLFDLCFTYIRLTISGDKETLNKYGMSNPILLLLFLPVAVLLWLGSLFFYLLIFLPLSFLFHYLFFVLFYNHWLETIPVIGENVGITTAILVTSIAGAFISSLQYWASKKEANKNKKE